MWRRKLIDMELTLSRLLWAEMGEDLLLCRHHHVCWWRRISSWCLVSRFLLESDILLEACSSHFRIHFLMRLLWTHCSLNTLDNCKCIDHMLNLLCLRLLEQGLLAMLNRLENDHFITTFSWLPLLVSHTNQKDNKIEKYQKWRPEDEETYSFVAALSSPSPLFTRKEAESVMPQMSPTADTAATISSPIHIQDLDVFSGWPASQSLSLHMWSSQNWRLSIEPAMRYQNLSLG